MLTAYFYFRFGFWSQTTCVNSWVNSYCTGLPNFNKIRQCTTELLRFDKSSLPVFQRRFCSPIFSQMTISTCTKYRQYSTWADRQRYTDLFWVSDVLLCFERWSSQSRRLKSKIEYKFRISSTFAKLGKGWTRYLLSSVLDLSLYFRYTFGEGRSAFWRRVW